MKDAAAISSQRISKDKGRRYGVPTVFMGTLPIEAAVCFIRLRQRAPIHKSGEIDIFSLDEMYEPLPTGLLLAAPVPVCLRGTCEQPISALSPPLHCA